MKQERTSLSSFLYLIIFASMILFSLPVSSAASAVDLGTASNFVILGGSGISNTGNSFINGNIGSYSTATITGFPPGTLIGTNHLGDAVTQEAKLNLTSAYNDAEGQTPTTYVVADLGGQTLTPGVYKDNGAPNSLGITGTLTLDGQDNPGAVFIFQSASTLTVAVSSNVVLINGANASNIFWQIGSSATLGTGSTFKGNILAFTSITLNTGAEVEGRLLAQNGLVTLDTNNVSILMAGADATSPTVTLNTQNNSWTNNNQSSLNFTFVDGESATANCSLFIDGFVYNYSLSTANNTPMLITPNDTLAEGAHTWYVNCTDLSDNEGTSTPRIINIDKTLPVVSLVSPDADAWSSTTTVTFTFNYTDASTAYCTLLIGGIPYGTNGSVLNNTNTAITANSSLSQGANVWYINCTDNATNTGSSSTRTVLVDSVYPNSLINNVNGVVNGYGTNNTTLIINFTANDTNMKNWTLSVYNSSWDLLQNWTESTVNLSSVEVYNVIANGTYYVNLTVRDNATNVNTTSFRVYVDQSAPIINNLTISSITTSGATLTVNASDTYSGIDNCSYSGAGIGTLAFGGGVYTASLTSLSSGTSYTVNVTCYDKAGYWVNNTTTFSTTSISVQPVVNLGTAGNFVILAKTGISTTAGTSIVGNIGISPAAATYITGFDLVLHSTYATSSLVNGKVYAADYAVPTPATMTTAISNMETAYTNASGRAGPDYTGLGAGNLGGLTLTPGLYKWTSGVTIPTNVTISGSETDVWIFQIDGTLDISTATHVILSGGAEAKNIFWAVAGQTTLGTYSVFNGNILDQTAIVIETGAKLNGRALAQSAVTLDANNVSLPVTLVTDILPPVITLNTQNNSWTNNNQSSLNFTFADDESATANCSLFIDGSVYNASLSAANGNPTLIMPNATLAEGTHTWYINCTDLSNNTGLSASYLINIDKTLPVVSLVSPATSSWSTSAMPIFTFNYTDASAASCTLFVNGSALGRNSSVVNNTNTAITANASLGQGSNNWYVNCTDQANNVGGSSIRTVSIDSIDPVITNITAINMTNVSAVVRFTASETTNCFVMYDNLSTFNSNTNVTALQGTGIINVTINALTSGTKYYYKVNCTDLVYRSSVSSVYTFSTLSEKVYEVNASNVTTIDVNTTVNGTESLTASFDIVLNETINATIAVGTSSSNPTGVDMTLESLPLYVTIESDTMNTSNIEWVVIKVYYNESDIPSGVDESLLRLYWFNTISSLWEEVTPGGVDTTANYVWGNTTHFSTYTVGETPSSIPSGGNGGTRIYTTGHNYTVNPTTTTSETLIVGDMVLFTLQGESHSAKLTGLTTGTATLEVRSTPFTVTLNVGETGQIDVTGDGVADISVYLASITSGKALVTFGPATVTQPITPVTPAVPTTPAETPVASTEPVAPTTPTAETQPETIAPEGFSSMELIVLGAILVAMLATLIWWFIRMRN